MATSGTGGDFEGSGVGGGADFKRVMISGIPTDCNKEWYVRMRLGACLPGEILDINTQGTANAIVTLRCEQGHPCEVSSTLDMGGGYTLKLRDLGTLSATLTFGDVPGDVVGEYKQLAEAHGVFFKATNTGFTFQGHVDSVYNLRAEVDARLLQGKTSQLTSSVEVSGLAGEPTAAPVAPPPGIPVIHRSFSSPSTVGHNPPTAITSGSRFDRTSPFHPSALGAATGHLTASGGTSSVATGGGYLVTCVPSTVSYSTLPPGSSYEPGPPTTGGHLPSKYLPTTGDHLPSIYLPDSGGHLPPTYLPTAGGSLPSKYSGGHLPSKYLPTAGGHLPSTYPSTTGGHLFPPYYEAIPLTTTAAPGPLPNPSHERNPPTTAPPALLPNPTSAVPDLRFSGPPSTTASPGPLPSSSTRPNPHTTTAPPDPSPHEPDPHSTAASTDLPVRSPHEPVPRTTTAPPDPSFYEPNPHTTTAPPDPTTSSPYEPDPHTTTAPTHPLSSSSSESSSPSPAGYPASAVLTTAPFAPSGGHDSGSDPAPTSPAGKTSSHFKPGDPGPENDPGIGEDPSVPSDKATHSSTSHKSHSPPPSDMGGKGKLKIIPGLDPDALALVQKLPEGKIPGVEYDIREGCVRIRLEGKRAVEATAVKFQDAYKKLFAHGSRFRVEEVKIPVGQSKKEVKTKIARFEEIYVFTAFVLDEAKRVVRVISNTRQLDQAKQFLEEALQEASGGASAALAGPLVIGFSHNRTLSLKKGNIVNEKADVLVNAANGQLLHGGGVAGALNSASKGELQRHSKKYMREERKGKEVPVGGVAVTHGEGELKCRRVIHAVGPDGTAHSSTQCEKLLNQVIHNTLKAAENIGATSIVLPAISCGIFGVSKDLVAHCIIDTILGFNYNKPAPILSDIRIVILDGPTHSCFARHFEQKLQPSKKHPGQGAHAHTPKVKPSKPSMKEGEKTLALEEVVLYPNDISWIMPLLRRAAPKWKLILMKIGFPNDYIMNVTTRKKDEGVILDKAVGKWIREHTPPGATLADLLKALCSAEVNEGEVASEIMTVCLQKRGMTKEEDSLPDVKYPPLPDYADEATSTLNGKDSTDEKDCPICLDGFDKPTKTECGHTFCKKCIEMSLKHDPFCPCCKTPLRAITGNQPPGGTMNYKILQRSLSGHGGYDTIQIDYYIPNGVQGPEHPNPRHPYTGTHRTVYLPCSKEGWEVFHLLQKAFDARMIFTIGKSVTSGEDNVVVWNDIHHKTSMHGGPYGYPDPTYLQRVKDDLAAKGIVPVPDYSIV